MEGHAVGLAVFGCWPPPACCPHTQSGPLPVSDPDSDTKVVCIQVLRPAEALAENKPPSMVPIKTAETEPTTVFGTGNSRKATQGVHTGASGQLHT
eukprot:361014-Chlamydomonas_euryale.AAC.2